MVVRLEYGSEGTLILQFIVNLPRLLNEVRSSTESRDLIGIGATRDIRKLVGGRHGQVSEPVCRLRKTAANGCSLTSRWPLSFSLGGLRVYDSESVKLVTKVISWQWCMD